jgi:hypothetical protein
VLFDQREHYLLVSLQGLDGCRFIFPHEAAIPDNISTEDGGQLALELLRIHGITSQMKKPPEGNRSPSEASLSKPSGCMFSWPSPEGCGYVEGLQED